MLVQVLEDPVLLPLLVAALVPPLLRALVPVLVLALVAPQVAPVPVERVLLLVCVNPSTCI